MMKKEEAFVELKNYLIEYREKVYITTEEAVPVDVTEEHLELLLTICEELKKIGFRLSDYCLTHMTNDDIVRFHKESLPALYNKLTAIFNPLYPGFPKQVLSADQKTLWKDQHHLYNTLDYEEFQQQHPWFSEEEIKGPSRLLELGSITKSELFELFTNILKNPGFSSTVDIRYLPNFLISFPEYTLPENIPNKTLKAIVINYRKDVEAKTINDILRIMAVKSGCVISDKNVVAQSYLRHNAESLKMPRRAQRLEITKMISAVLKSKGLNNCVIDAKKYYSAWVIFSKKYHFGDYKNKYPEVAEFIHTLFTPEEQKKITSWNSKIHKLYHSLNKDNFNKLLDFIAGRPGEYMRRFDSLVRKAIKLEIDPETVVNKIFDLEVNSKLLLEVLNYYDRRMANVPRLVYDEDGMLMKSLPVLEKLPEELYLYINYNLCIKIYDNIRKFNKDGNIFESKKIYIDPALKNIPVPYNMKGAGNLSIRGAKYPIPEDAKAIRLFVRWIDKQGIEDLDLHSIFVDSNNKCSYIGWDSHYLNKYGVFSGDVRRRKGNCAEYIDINLDEASTKFKYLIANVHNYENRPLNSLEAWIGYELLSNYSESVSNKYYPGDVDFMESLVVSYKSMAAFMLDFEKKEIVILNTDLTSIPSRSSDKAIYIVKFFNADPTLSVYNITQAWYSARGANLVSLPEEAEEIVDINTLKDYTTIQSMLTL